MLVQYKTTIWDLSFIYMWAAHDPGFQRLAAQHKLHHCKSYKSLQARFHRQGLD